jgi:GntR family transcriptional regulator
MYEQIADQLAVQIWSGAIRPGAPMPSEAAIVEEFGISRGTARRSIQALRDRGLVVTVPQRGTYSAC